MADSAPTPPSAARVSFPWAPCAWFAALLLLAYAPVLVRLVWDWYIDEDMGHGFFVPLLAGYIAWQKRAELTGIQPNYWGLALIAWGAFQLMLGTFAVELFLARTAFVFSLMGVVLYSGGTRAVRTLAFPLFLLFFMVPIPSVIYYQITFPLQLLASRVAEAGISLLGIPVLRQGNILVLPDPRPGGLDFKLSVVEACSGIRSLLSLSFLSLIYGYFFERRAWVRVLLLAATVPIAIVANASRVTFTGLVSRYDPALAEGFLHGLSGWVIFLVAVLLLVAFHGAISLGLRRRARAR